MKNLSTNCVLEKQYNKKPDSTESGACGTYECKLRAQKIREGVYKFELKDPSEETMKLISVNILVNAN